MIVRIISILILLALAGCESYIDSLWRVDCDSGFTTGVSYYSGIHDGVIVWRSRKEGNLKRRKMIPGEICIDKRIR